MTERPEALRLADELEMWTLGEPAAAELRRLHAQRDALLEALKWLDKWMSDKTIPECVWKVRAAIKAVEEDA